MDLKIFLMQLLVFSEVFGQDCQGTFSPECQRLIRSASKEIGIIQCWGKPLYAYCKATDGTVFPIPGFNCKHSTCPDDAKGQIATGSSEDSCRDDLKGNGNCDPVNNNAKCNYDYGDCCEKKKIGDGKCDARNNFITCNLNPDLQDAGRHDGGDCRPRKCFANENDPLDIAYTAKYGTSSWFDNLRGDQRLVNGTWQSGTWSDFEDESIINYGSIGYFSVEPDKQSFFPEIINKNECRALNCFLHESLAEADSCWRGLSWKYEHITCDLTTNGHRSPIFDAFGSGCFCAYRIVWTGHECCLDAGGTTIYDTPNNGEKNCKTDLSSSQHPCKNIKGITWNNELQPILPETSENGCSTINKNTGSLQPCCENEYGSEDFDPNLPCSVKCSATQSMFNPITRMTSSGGPTRNSKPSPRPRRPKPRPRQ